MLEVHQCEKCGEMINVKLTRGFAHIVCPSCQATYQFTQTSIKRYLIVPLISVAVSVFTSIYFLNKATIDIKTIYILGLSFVLSFIISKLMLKYNVLSYEEHHEVKP